MSSEAFEITRISLVLFTIVVRVGMTPYYLQAYLNMAHDRVEEQKKEAGRITNKELQKKVARVFYYLCVVTLQYIAPMVMCFFVALMYKTLGGLSWAALWGGAETEIPHVVSPTLPPSTNTGELPSLLQAEGISETTQVLSLGLEELKKVFTTELYRGVFGFFTWWCVFSWFLSGTFGVLYQTYFTRR